MEKTVTAAPAAPAAPAETEAAAAAETEAAAAAAETKKAVRAEEVGILQLAYLGDAVMELFTREALLKLGDFPSGKLNKMAKGFVTCEAQSDAAERILPLLTEEEAAVFRRGRNAKTNHTPAHGAPIQYRRATGLEALFGYLYRTGCEARARALFDAAYRGTAEEMARRIR